MRRYFTPLMKEDKGGEGGDLPQWALDLQNQVGEMRKKLDEKPAEGSGTPEPQKIPTPPVPPRESESSEETPPPVAPEKKRSFLDFLL